jgi:hypothetical protein
LGRFCLLRGQNLVPFPPAMITAYIIRLPPNKFRVSGVGCQVLGKKNIKTEI